MTAEGSNNGWRGEVTTKLEYIKEKLDAIDKRFAEHLDTYYIQTKHCVERFKGTEGKIYSLKDSVGRLTKLFIGVAIIVLSAAAITVLLKT